MWLADVPELAADVELGVVAVDEVVAVDGVVAVAGVVTAGGSVVAGCVAVPPEPADVPTV